MIDRKMSVADLRKKAEIAPNTMTRMRKDQEVSMQVLSRICDVLNADFGEIVEFVPNKTTKNKYYFDGDFSPLVVVNTERATTQHFLEVLL